MYERIETCMLHVNRTAALHSLGCKVNAYETEAMREQLEAAGYRIVPFEPGADVYVINTCSVTNIADRKSRQMLARARKMNPDAVVAATGCYVQTARQQTGLDVKADIILGNNEKQNLVSVLEAFFADRECKTEYVLNLQQMREYEPLSIEKTSEHTRAFVKVQDGCNQFCSYCIIPYARGRVRSRKSEEVLQEVQTLAQNGICEIVLTGIHLSSYGAGLSEKTDLVDLTEAICRVPGIARVRLGSLEQSIVTETFAKRLREQEAFCPHFHLSLQSGDDGVLRRMNRRYTGAQFLEKIELLRSHFHDPAMTTDIIVGFPQESEEEFARTREFLQKADFYETHVFRYSRRAGTRAAAMDGQIPEHVKEERSALLMADDRLRREAFCRRRDGQRGTVLFEEPAMYGTRKGLAGYTKEYVKVFFETEADLSNTMREGTLVFHAGEEMMELQGC